MQRKAKACVPGVAALLAALLVGCSGGSGLGDESDDSKPGEGGSSTAPAQPGKYRTLPEPCGELDRDTLDAMLPGIAEMEDTEQRDKAYEGTPTVTYDTDRRVGCRWKVQSSDASHHLFVDFERVVSYDGTVSDDDRAAEVYATKLRDADLPEPAASGSDEDEPDEPDEPKKSDESEKAKGSGESGKGKGSEAGDKAQGGKSAKTAASDDDKGKKDDGKGKKDGEQAADATTQPATPPPGLEPRALDDLGDEAFLDDALATAASATRHRTVTVVFRTSNVIVTIEYDEQPGRRTDVPDSKEMQDKALELADTLAGDFDE
ncbi:DUF3558 domain-containing protein [Streptomyces sp. NPDC041068]|uniref:DUF3558 domain-containing protein n=1 Tax=Streptomyces sp. NPDC041068 TaxID=3155130 RepID=UPI0033D345CE